MHIFRFNIPTFLTFIRIALIPPFLYFTPNSPLIGILFFLLASITDFLDGYIARRSNQITKFGIIIDPIADKMLIIAALILLVDMVRISTWIAVVIIGREFLVSLIRVVGILKGIVIPAEKGGKIKTATQMVAIIFLLLPGSLVNIDFYDVGLILIYISLVFAVISGYKYTVFLWRNI
ncbi:MAG: CDP-diacylglycerol--glycerol-3-phosphate 3-phosphatidyltransferase [Thermodesulfovibrionales bacterium]|nr:CDP-diacylglycerol--glycerol-3-phosphate 3-phosphatidyltransferase [Thermodesulfovibrionales bacterium]